MSNTKDKGQSQINEADMVVGPGEVWELRLYVSGQTEKSITALANLKKIAEEHLAGRYHIEVIDIRKNPQLARDEQIIGLPALVRKLPQPIRKIIGDLSKTERVLVGLDIKVGKDER